MFNKKSEKKEGTVVTQLQEKKAERDESEDQVTGKPRFGTGEENVEQKNNLSMDNISEGQKANDSNDVDKF